MDADFLSNSEAYFTLTPEERLLVNKTDFANSYANGANEIYNNSTPQERIELEKGFIIAAEAAAFRSEYNPSNIKGAENQAAADNNNLLSTTTTKVIDSSAETFKRNLNQALGSTVPTGTVSPELIQSRADAAEKEKERIVTKGQLTISKALDNFEKVTKDTTWGDWSTWKEAGKVLATIAQNPGGTISVAADSIGSAAWIGGGSIVGGIAGSYVLPVVGTKIGATTAMWSAEMIDAATSKNNELWVNKAKSLGMEPTKAAFEKIAEDKEWVKQAQITSDEYGAALATIDTGIGMGLGSIASIPYNSMLRTARTAIKQAARTTSRGELAMAAKTAKQTVEQFTETLAQRSAVAQLKATSLKTQAARVTGTYAGEILSEPVSEAGAKAAIGEKATFTDLMNETIGGIGSGPIMTVVDRTLLTGKAAGTITKNFVGNILSATPESKAMAKTQKDALEVAKTQSRTQADAGYNKDIAAMSHTDAAHAELSDPAHSNYNPIKAVEILAKDDSPDAYNKATAIESHERKSLLSNMERYEELVAKRDSATGWSKAEEEEAIGLNNLIPVQTANIKKLNTFVDTIYNKATAKRNAARNTTTVNPATATQAEVVDSVSFGSSPHKNALTTENIDTLIKRPDLDTDVKDLLTNMKAATIARSNIDQRAQRHNTDGKTIVDVSNDIYHGIRNSDFKGIDAYVQGITHYLNPQVNDPAKATKELNGLKKFRDAHAEKAAVVTEAFAAVSRGEKPTAEHQTYLTKHGLKIERVVSKNLVANIQQEAAALDSEVKLAESLYKTLSKKSNTTTSTTTQTAPTAAPAAPKPAPATTTAAQTVADRKRVSVLADQIREDKTEDTGSQEIQDIIDRAVKNKQDKVYVDNLKRLKATYEAKHTARNATPVVTSAPATKPVVENKPAPDLTQAEQEHVTAAVELLKERGVVSATSIQREFNIGFNAASKILQHMQKTGIIDKDGKAIEKPEFKTQAEVIVEQEAQVMQENGLTPDHPAHTALLERRTQEANRLDPVTGAIPVEHFMGTFKRAWTEFLAGRKFVYSEMDIANVGGANAKFGASGFDTHFRAIIDILQAELKNVSPTCQVFRKGGDEFGVIAPDITAAQLEKALIIAQEKIKAYTDANGMGDINNPKPNRNNGVGLVYSVRDFTDKNSIEDLRAEVDTEVELRKKKDPNYVYAEGENDGNNQPSETLGSVTSGTQTEGTGSGTTADAQGTRSGQGTESQETRTEPVVNKPRKPRKRVPPMRNFFTDIRKAGGIRRELLMQASDPNEIMHSYIDKNGRKRTVNRYRRISNPESSWGVDQMAQNMRDLGWQVPLDLNGNVDVQAFMDMIISHKNDGALTHPDDVERKLAIAERKLLKAQFVEYQAYLAEEAIAEIIEAYNDNANTEMEDGYDATEIAALIEEVAREDATRQETVVHEATGEVSQTDVREVRGETVADTLADFDGLIDPQVQVIDASGKPVMMSYTEAKAYLQSQIDEATDILKCVKG